MPEGVKRNRFHPDDRVRATLSTCGRGACTYLQQIPFIECLARSGDIQKARFLFEKMLGYANHVGLYPEELGPSGGHLGNFPQAFTHMALISAAFQLNRGLDEKGK
jgi:pentatricopeptide repeat protein